MGQPDEIESIYEVDAVFLISIYSQLRNIGKRNSPKFYPASFLVPHPSPRSKLELTDNMYAIREEISQLLEKPMDYINVEGVIDGEFHAIFNILEMITTLLTDEVLLKNGKGGCHLINLPVTEVLVAPDVCKSQFYRLLVLYRIYKGIIHVCC